MRRRFGALHLVREGISDRQLPVNDLTGVQILGVLGALRFERGGNDERVVDVKPVSAGETQRRIVRGQRQRQRGWTERLDGVERLGDVIPRQGS